MKDFELLDQDEQAFAKKPRPVGWFVAGALVIAGLACTFGFYVPLSSAHDKLLSEHEKLAQKAHELDHALKAKTAALSSTESKHQKLERFVTAASDQEKSLAAKLEIARATAETGLAAFTKAKLAEMEVTDRGLRIAYGEKALFRPGTSALLPQAKRPLCAGADALKQNADWRVSVTVPAGADDAKYWDTAGERAGALARMLEDSCKVLADKIDVTAVRPSGEGAEKIVAVYGPELLPRLKGSEAPLEAEATGSTAAPGE